MACLNEKEQALALVCKVLLTEVQEQSIPSPAQIGKAWKEKIHSEIKSQIKAYFDDKHNVKSRLNLSFDCPEATHYAARKLFDMGYMGSYMSSRTHKFIFPKTEKQFWIKLNYF